MDEISTCDIDDVPPVDLRAALCLVYDKLEQVYAGLDPAPWMVAGASHIHNTAFAGKLHWLAPFLVHTALLNGELVAELASDGESLWTVPGWAWAGNFRFRTCLLIEKLALSPMLPQLRQYEGRNAYIARSDFDSWLAQCEAIAFPQEPSLPVPFDLASRPPFQVIRELENKAWIGLTEACTWIAFSFPMTAHELEDMEAAEEIQFLRHRRFDYVGEGLNALLQASMGLKPKIVMFGENCDNYPHSSALPEAIDSAKLTKFPRPDWLRNGLMPADDSADYLGSADSLCDGYRYVMVDRVQLLDVFPSPFETTPAARPRAGKYKGGDEKRDKLILEAMVAMKAETGLDGRAVAKMLPKQRGFDDVAVTFARSLIDGQFKQGSGQRKGA